MNTTKNDGGPAFPQPSYVELDDDMNNPQKGNITCQPGMTLSDYFAAKALQMIVINDVSGRTENFRDHYAQGACEWADAMIAARNKD